MKKAFLFILLLAGVMAPFTVSAQKKSKKSKKQAKDIVKPIPSITSSADTISYAFGVNMVQGLSQHLIQMGVLADTAAIDMEYAQKIAMEGDAAKKSALESELSSKKAEVSAANAVNLEEFLGGFKETIGGNGDRKAYNAGISVASQVSGMTQRFTDEILNEGESLNIDAFVLGFTSAIKNETLLVENPQELMQTSMEKAQRAKETATEAAMAAQYEDKIAEGKLFMEGNAKKKGVVVRPSGLQYEVLTKGKGELPRVNDKVKVHYHGTLLDGTVFDSSVDRGEAIEFNVGQLIRGWNEALLIMPEGSKWRLYIPYDLAYGTRDQGVIKPYSDLIFDVELISIVERAEEQ